MQPKHLCRQSGCLQRDHGCLSVDNVGYVHIRQGYRQTATDRLDDRLLCSPETQESLLCLSQPFDFTRTEEPLRYGFLVNTSSIALNIDTALRFCYTNQDAF